MSVAPDEFQAVLTKGEAKPIAIPDIESGLTQLWRSAAEKDSDNAVSRACVLNLIVFAGGEENIQRATDAVAQFTLSHPSRGIVLVTEPNAKEPGLKSWISAHCQLPTPDGKQVCCEQITIEAAGPTLDRMASVVTPLLVSDLPVVVWWPGQPQLEGVLFDHLMKVTDRLIVDSSEFEGVTQTLNKLSALASQRYQGVTFSDLNWARLTVWRDLVAQFFDDGTYLPYLSTIDYINVTFARNDPSKNLNTAQALMLIVWLASRLNWQTIPNLVPTRTETGFSTVLSHRGRPVSVELTGIDREKVAANGTLTGVTIRSTHEGKSATFSIEASDATDHATATITVDGTTVSTHMVTLPQETEIDLLSEELSIVERDRIYERTLEIAGRLATSMR